MMYKIHTMPTPFECCCTRTLDYINTTRTMPIPEWTLYCTESGQNHDKFSSYRFCPSCGAKNESQHIVQPPDRAPPQERDSHFSNYREGQQYPSASSSSTSLPIPSPLLPPIASTSAVHISPHETGSTSSSSRRSSFQTYPHQEVERHRQSSVLRTDIASTKAKANAGSKSLSSRSMPPPSTKPSTKPTIRFAATLVLGTYRLEDNSLMVRTKYIWRKLGISSIDNYYSFSKAVY